ncbi:MAG TPA: zinc-binding dehydrogenase [Gemmatimonadota bacterium]|nr:zinc-binding dehydrogenase [Gemmatimonadota bacterium]
MRAVEYVRSVPRYLAARVLGRAWPGIHTSSLAAVRLVEIDPPVLPGPRWARVRPILSGICGSDLATITAEGSPYFSPLTSTPFVFGHEVVGEVIEAGPEVDRVRPGDRVVLAPPLHCAVRGISDPCAPCRAGEIGHCRNVTRGAISAGIQTGYCRDTGGGWSGSLVAHDLQLYRVPDEVSDEAAVLIEPFACCLHAVERSGLEEGATALVIGCGTIGLLTITALRAVGPPCRIVAVAKHRHQQAAARMLGADPVVGTDHLRAELARALGAELHHPEIGPPVALGGADVTFDCVGSSRTLDDALRFTRERGTAVVVGMPGVPTGVDWTALWHKELDVRGSYTAGDATFARAVALAARHGESLSLLVGARYPLKEYRAAIATALATGRSGVIKTVFAPRM